MRDEEFIVLSNNPMVYRRLKEERQVIYIECSYEEILREARNRVHKGYRLLSHPLSGSVKPRETPYKSMMLSAKKGGLDMRSLAVVESALEACKKFADRERDYTDEVYEDFQLIDFSLLESAIASV